MLAAAMLMNSNALFTMSSFHEKQLVHALKAPHTLATRTHVPGTVLTNYFLSAFLIFFSAFFSFGDLAGAFFVSFLVSTPLLMVFLLAMYDC
jgi:hypothetical protein